MFIQDFFFFSKACQYSKVAKRHIFQHQNNQAKTAISIYIQPTQVNIVFTDTQNCHTQPELHKKKHNSLLLFNLPHLPHFLYSCVVAKDTKFDHDCCEDGMAKTMPPVMFGRQYRVVSQPSTASHTLGSWLWCGVSI